MTSPAAVSSASPEDVVEEVAGEPFTVAETASAVALGVLALLISGLFGLLFSALAEEHRLSASGIGLAAMVEALSTGLTTGLAGILLKPRGLRSISAVATLLVVAADLATTQASGSSVLLARAAAGLPEGILLWIAIGLISRTVTPERWAAVLFTGMGLTQLALASAVSAWILPRFGANGGFVAVAGGMALALPLALFLPRSLGAAPGAGEGGVGAPPLRGWIALLGTLCFAAPPIAVSIYVVPLASEAGLGVAVGRTAISVGLACQMLGGALATVLAGRVRYIAIFWICTAAFLTAWTVYAIHAPAWLFVAMAGVAGLVAMLAGPFLLPMTVEADPSRRTTMQSGTVQLLAGAVGPLLAAMVVASAGPRGVIVASAGLLLVGLAVFTALHRSAVAERRRGGA